MWQSVSAWGPVITDPDITPPPITHIPVTPIQVLITPTTAPVITRGTTVTGTAAITTVDMAVEAMVTVSSIAANRPTVQVSVMSPRRYGAGFRLLVADVFSKQSTLTF